MGCFHRTLAAAAALVCLLFHCGPVAGDSNSSSSGGVTTEDFLVGGLSAIVVAIKPQTDEEEAAWVAQGARFSALYPNVQVVFKYFPASSSDALSFITSALKAGSTEYDVFPMDGIWTGDLAEWLVDINSFGSAYLNEAVYPALLQNNSPGGKFISVPWYNGYGMLYSRSDLLTKYGFSTPLTWDEMQNQASVIVAGEAKTNPSLVGYTFQGSGYEGLTCNLMEWIASHGGGGVYELAADNTTAKLTINNPNVVRALTRARGWVGTISPLTAVQMTETTSHAPFLAGNVVFMRNWAYVGPLIPGTAVEGKVRISYLPGETASQSRATIGAWGIGVNKASQNIGWAVEFAKFLATPAEQVRMSFTEGQIPILMSSYLGLNSSSQMCNTTGPSFCDVPDPQLIARPSTLSSPNYAAVSTALFTWAHDVLTSTTDIQPTLDQLECDLATIVSFDVARCRPSSSSWTSSAWFIGILCAAIVVVLVLGFLLWISMLRAQRRERILTEAKDTAEKASLMKSEFLANMSHEIRTPLAGILGNATLLKFTSLSFEQSEYTQQIEDSSTHLLTVINDILQFSRLDAGGVELEDVPFELSSCLEQAIHLAFKSGQDDRLELFYFLDQRLPVYIKGDSTRLRQVLINLLGNACKFTSEGQVVVYARLLAAAPVLSVAPASMAAVSSHPSSVSTFKRRLQAKLSLSGGDTMAVMSPDTKSRSLADAKLEGASSSPSVPRRSIISDSSSVVSSPASSAQSAPAVERPLLSAPRPSVTHEHASRPLQPGEILVEFEVRDTGIGIPSDRIDRLFKAFSQVDSSIARQFGGTGLGLSISLGLAALMGGKLRVQSEVGKGSSFFVTLITRDGADQEAVAAASVSTAHDNAPASMMPLTLPPGFKREPSADARLLPIPQLATRHFPGLQRAVVLLVHENITFHEALAEQFGRWNLSLLTADSPEQAVRWLRLTAGGNSPRDGNGSPRLSSIDDRPEVDQDGIPARFPPALIICNAFFPTSERIPNAAFLALELTKVWSVAGVSPIPLMLFRPSASMVPVVQSGPLFGSSMRDLGGYGGNGSGSNSGGLSASGLSANSAALLHMDDESIGHLFQRILRKPVVFSHLYKVLWTTLKGDTRSPVLGVSRRGLASGVSNAHSRGLGAHELAAGGVPRTIMITPHSGSEERKEGDRLMPSQPNSRSNSRADSRAGSAMHSPTASEVPVPIPSLLLDQLFAPPPMSSLYPLRILIADDDSTNRKLLRRFLLKLGYSHTTLSAADNILECHEEARPISDALISTEAEATKGGGGGAGAGGAPATTKKSTARRPRVPLGPEGVHAAEDGKQAVARLKAHHYDLVFMDMQMPFMSGIEATRAFRQWFDNDLPVLVAKGEIAPRPVAPHIIALTANALDDHRDACLQAGMQDFMSKPFSIKALASMLATVSKKVYGRYHEYHRHHPLPVIAKQRSPQVENLSKAIPVAWPGSGSAVNGAASSSATTAHGNLLELTRFDDSRCHPVVSPDAPVRALRSLTPLPPLPVAAIELSTFSSSLDPRIERAGSHSAEPGSMEGVVSSSPTLPPISPLISTTTANIGEYPPSTNGLLLHHAHTTSSSTGGGGTEVGASSFEFHPAAELRREVSLTIRDDSSGPVAVRMHLYQDSPDDSGWPAQPPSSFDANAREHGEPV